MSELNTSLNNKVAVITGAGSGIGKAIAQAFAAAGCKVVIADIDENAAAKTVEQIKSSGKEAISVVMNVTDENSVNNSIASIVNTWGTIDILVSNAGTQKVAAINTLEFADWKKLLAIQLDGAFLTTRACLQVMYKNGNGGAVIYMGSMQSIEGSANKAPYVVAKHGLSGLCKVAAKEGAKHNVRAYLLCPGYVWTPLVDKQIPDLMKAHNFSKQEIISQIFLDGTVDDRFTTVEEIANAALFVASDTTGALTGQPIMLGHGRCML